MNFVADPEEIRLANPPGTRDDASPLAAAGNERARMDEPSGEVIRQALKNSGWRELGELQVVVAPAQVSLIGQVSTFYLRQLAIEVVVRVAKNCRIDDQIKVDLPR